MDAWQVEVDKIGKAFEKTVAKGRGLTTGAVNKTFGQGRCFNAAEAKDIGMIDRVDTLNGVIEKLGGSAPTGMNRRFAQAKLDIIKNS